jgi:hypothetical protein
MKNCVAIIIAAVLFNAIALKASDAPDANTIYDSDTNHLWNRLNETLFERTAQDGKKYGLDELDILYWNRTTNLLAGVSHQQAISVLDEFINTHGEKLIRDPLKRALLQRDLWELFDWSAVPFPYFRAQFSKERSELQSRLAIVIRRLALTTNEIASLPDNYALTEKNNLSDLPRGLFQTNGDWVNVGDNNDILTAPTHVATFKGHSLFYVILHLPDGRQAAISYLDKLRLFEHVWIYQTNPMFPFTITYGSDGTNSFPIATNNEPREILTLNPDLPQFPTNTEWALVRRMCVIDTEGRIQPTPITESIQLRRYQNVESNIPDPRISANFVQQFFEFELDRRQTGVLHSIGQDEGEFNALQLFGRGMDPFESSFRNSSREQQPRDSVTLQTKELKTCFECHSSRGIFSVKSYTRDLSFPSSSQRPANLMPLIIEREETDTIDWKQQQFSWGLLQGLWANYPSL